MLLRAVLATASFTLLGPIISVSCCLDLWPLRFLSRSRCTGLSTPPFHISLPQPLLAFGPGLCGTASSFLAFPSPQQQEGWRASKAWFTCFITGQQSMRHFVSARDTCCTCCRKEEKSKLCPCTNGQSSPQQGGESHPIDESFRGVSTATAMVSSDSPARARRACLSEVAILTVSSFGVPISFIWS